MVCVYYFNNELPLLRKIRDLVSVAEKKKETLVSFACLVLKPGTRRFKGKMQDL